MSELTSHRQTPTDAELWETVRQGDVEAFEGVVQRHQNAVCAVAYCILGDRSMSEDLAQDAFWTAWQQRNQLRDAERLRAWLCGIVRNLAKDAAKKQQRERLAVSDAGLHPTEPDLLPIHHLARDEEESLVWRTLAEIPETYREPLVLFYREGRSTAEVAITLEISEEAVRQRLVRGRGMLREQVLQVVERTLDAQQPSAAFSMAVMAGLAQFTTLGKMAAVGGSGAAGITGTSVPVAVSAASKTLGGGALGGALAGATGGLIGGAAGLFGAWLGSWIPAQLAATKRERQVIERMGRIIMGMAIVLFIMMIAIAILACLRIIGFGWLIAATVGSSIGTTVVALVLSISVQRRLQAIRREPPLEGDENITAFRQGAAGMARCWRGRRYRSSASFLGRPWIDIQVADPLLPNVTASNASPPPVARGWIAIGNRADGVLLAIGNVATGFIAIGGKACGVIAFGGVAFGILAVGGAAIGGVALGGMSLGVLALGGISLGWQAMGGVALGWDFACGGAAFAYHGAFGGSAIAHDWAEGGYASALHANDEVGKAMLESQPLKRVLDWQIRNNALFILITLSLSLLLPLLICVAQYRRARPEEMESP